MDALAANSWIDADPACDAFCFSVVVGEPEDAVLVAFAVDASTRQLLTFGMQPALGVPYPRGYGNDTVFVDALGDAVVAGENNGWAGVEEERAAALSTGGSFTAIYRNVNALMRFVHARGGRVVRTFDPLLYNAEGALDEERDLSFGVGQAASAALTLLERLTGIRLERGWLVETPHPTFRRDPAR
jgi:hypothetical protein